MAVLTTPWRLGALLALLAALVVALVLRHSSGETAAVPRNPVTPVDVVHAYIAAREAGDGERACSLLSQGQQFSVVAHVSGNRAAARPEDCPNYVLRTSSASTAVRPELAEFSQAPLVAEPAEGHSISVHPEGSREFLELIHEDGVWRIDGEAAEKGSFVEHDCPHYGIADSASACACIFEELRRAGLQLYGDPSPAAAIDQAIRRAVPRCGA